MKFEIQRASSDGWTETFWSGDEPTTIDEVQSKLDFAVPGKYRVFQVETIRTRVKDELIWPEGDGNGERI